MVGRDQRAASGDLERGRQGGQPRPADLAPAAREEGPEDLVLGDHRARGAPAQPVAVGDQLDPLGRDAAQPVDHLAEVVRGIDAVVHHLLREGGAREPAGPARATLAATSSARRGVIVALDAVDLDARAPERAEHDPDPAGAAASGAGPGARRGVASRLAGPAGVDAPRQHVGAILARTATAARTCPCATAAARAASAAAWWPAVVARAPARLGQDDPGRAAAPATASARSMPSIASSSSPVARAGSSLRARYAAASQVRPPTRRSRAGRAPRTTRVVASSEAIASSTRPRRTSILPSVTAKIARSAGRWPRPRVSARASLTSASPRSRSPSAKTSSPSMWRQKSRKPLCAASGALRVEQRPGRRRAGPARGGSRSGRARPIARRHRARRRCRPCTRRPRSGPGSRGRTGTGRRSATAARPPGGARRAAALVREPTSST